MSDYYTHRECLSEVLKSLDYSTPKKCLEFGTGDGSALVFNKFAQEQKNILIESFEFDYNWFSLTKKKYELNNYQFNYIDGFCNINFRQFKSNFYDLIFIDQGNWQSRIDVINNLKFNTKYFILHDYDFYNKGLCTNIFSIGTGSFFEPYTEIFELKKYCTELPPTLLFSLK